MKEIEEIYRVMDKHVLEIEGEDASEEVAEEYKIFDKNTKELLDSADMESYMELFDTICKSENGVLECFDKESVDELKLYVAQNEISFDNLKIETAKASCEALKFLIYEAEDEEY